MNYNGKRESVPRSVLRGESLRPFTQLNEQTRIRGKKEVSFNIYCGISDSLPAIFMPKKLPQLVPNISFNFLQLFRTFPLFFDTFHQNHPKTILLFNRISHFLTTFCQKSSLFQRTFRTFYFL